MNMLEKKALKRLRNRDERGQASGIALTVVLVLVGLAALKGWALMVAWGIVAGILGIATIGFFPAVAVALLLSLALGTGIGASTN